MQQADPQRRGVDRAVVDGRQGEDGLAMSSPAEGVVASRFPPQLVEDLAGLFAGQGVDYAALAPGERAQRAEGEVAAERQQHARRPDRVPAE